jgi:hypothetical protein
MLLSSVLITSGPRVEANLPALIAENIESLKRHHPGADHKLFLHDDIVALLSARFSKTVLDAYEALQPYAYKADLARYCILYEYGGLYADVSYYFVGSIPTDGTRPTVFRDNLVSAPWDTSNAIIYAPPEHKALERAIQMVCGNVERRFYGYNSLCPTGPALFGKAVASTCEAHEIITGTAIPVRRERLEELSPNLFLPGSATINCLTLGQRIVALKRKRMMAKGLTELGVENGNAYNDLYRDRQIYRDPEPAVHSEG